MALPVPNLDDRNFQDIVNQAKSLIPQYCPTWTDHNVSDPGVALIELFAWMTDLMLYRVNQVPDKVYVKMLDMIGVRLLPPRSAQAAITFYLSAPQPNEIVIPEGTEVATVQTETNPAIVFTTEADLPIRPAILSAAVSSRREAQVVTHDLAALDYPNRSLDVFPSRPEPGDCFDLALDNDHSQHILSLSIVCERAGGAGIFLQAPPWEWLVWQGDARGWVPCTLDFDTTGGFNLSGTVQLAVPAMTPRTLHGRRAYWLRCRLTDAQASDAGYEITPRLLRLTVESWGGTVSARHATTVRNVMVGVSDGTPGQTFTLPYRPVLARDPQREYLTVTPPEADGSAAASDAWTEVADFADSGPSDRHFVLDSMDGTITLGPSLPQPDGSVYLFGAVPPRGSVLRFSRYQYGGGVIGNLPRQALTVLKSSIPYVRAVENREPSSGGLDAQSLDDAKLRAPAALRARTRAVTADDYEFFALGVPGVARAYCLAPGPQPVQPSQPQDGEPRPGEVFVFAIPRVDNPRGFVPLGQMQLSDALRTSVVRALEPRRPVGIALQVREPQYIAVEVQVTVRVTARADDEGRKKAAREAEDLLFRYLSPYTGGPEEAGWPFGRALAIPEIYALLQRIPTVEYVEDVHIGISGPGTPMAAQQSPQTLEIPPYAVICSGHHQIRVT